MGWRVVGVECMAHRGTSFIRNIPPHIARDIVLLSGPRMGLFLMSEVPL